ncbi:MAG: 16S rRNA (cytidine(1402)-2'-O)-methyltransferase [Desulfobacterales bacterium]
MHSTLPTNDPQLPEEKGILYIVATPIGNMDDITLRAIHILGEVALIAAEDTRRSGQLLAHHGIRGRLISYEEHNEHRRTPELISRLKEGASVALVSDAGTPSVSDPGYRLVRAAIENDIEVVPIPGASAVMTALSASGLPTDAFVFIGFPERKKARRLSQLKQLSEEPRTLVFYESPRRITRLIAEIVQVMGDRYGVLSREMTKLHEEFLRDDLSGILRAVEDRPSVKGECTLLVSGWTDDQEASMAAACQDLEKALVQEGQRLSDVVRRVAQRYGLPRKEVYQEALEIRDRNT